MPGQGFVLIGITALLTAAYAETAATASMTLLIWSGEAVIALTIGIAALWMKSRRTGVDLRSGPARKFLLAFLPSGICAAALSLAMADSGQMGLIPTVWLSGYGTGVIAAGAHSVPAIPAMGIFFVAAAVLSLFVAAEHHNLILGGAFGAIHVAFGAYIARNHGG